MKTVTKILNMIRLGFFPLAYGLTGAFIGGTLNRVMIAELNIRTSLVGFFFAIPLLVSPLRVWLGYRSDGFPIFGKRREPYMILGILIAGVGLFLATTFAINTADSPTMLLLAVIVAFVVYGFGRNLGHNTFQALLADKFKGKSRPRAVTAYEVVTLLGFVVGAGGIGAALETYDPARMVTVAVGISITALVLTILASIMNEPKSASTTEVTRKAREVPFQQAVKSILVGDKQVKLFFLLVMLTFIGTLAQDVLLEPYGALVLNMDVGDTTRLTMFWGLGVMAAMLVSGLFLINRLGYMRVMRIGLVFTILVFTGVVVAGAMGQTSLFQVFVIFMGLGTGMAGAGMLVGAINFTTAIRAGMLMGVWGVANQVGHAFGSLMGGGVVDLVLSITGNAFAAYASVFTIEALLLVVALYLSYRFVPEEASVIEEAETIELAAVGALGD
jgi:BCD family chlorophyll transporter-like MFS transporter